MRLRWGQAIQLAYLSAAPRRSTRADPEAGFPSPRSWCDSGFRRTRWGGPSVHLLATVSRLWLGPVKEERRSLVLQAWLRPSSDARIVCTTLSCTSAMFSVSSMRRRVLPGTRSWLCLTVWASILRPTRFVAAKRHFSWLMIGFVGAVIGWRQLHLLLEATTALQTPFDVSAIIIDGGPARAESEDEARRLGIGTTSSSLAASPETTWSGFFPTARWASMGVITIDERRLPAAAE